MARGLDRVRGRSQQPLRFPGGYTIPRWIAHLWLLAYGTVFVVSVWQLGRSVLELPWPAAMQPLTLGGVLGFMSGCGFFVVMDWIFTRAGLRPDRTYTMEILIDEDGPASVTMTDAETGEVVQTSDLRVVQAPPGSRYRPH